MTSDFSVAVHALVYLNHKAVSLCSEALSENICTNPARVRRVLSKLKKAGLVETKEGLDGGYQFRLDPRTVNLAQISRALDTRFVSASWRSGDADMDCLVASGMAEVMDGIYGELDELCRQRLEQINIAELDRRIFSRSRPEPL